MCDKHRDTDPAIVPGWVSHFDWKVHQYNMYGFRFGVTVVKTLQTIDVLSNTSLRGLFSFF